MIFINKLKSLIFLNKNIIQTSFGSIKSEVSLFPLIYLFFVHLSGLITWEIWNEETIYRLWTKPEYLAEHFQFIFYLSSSLLSALIILKNKYKLFSLQNLCWIVFFVFVSIMTFEEISFLISLKGNIFQIIRDNNFQNEINFHNSFLFSPYLHSGYIFLNLFLGWFGWKYFSIMEAIPKKYFSLYFLFTAVAYSILELKISMLFNFKEIVIAQEAFEFLMAMGLFLHALKMFNYYSKKN